MRSAKPVVLLVGAVLLTACQQREEYTCTSDLRVAVKGKVVDASGALINPESISVRVDGGEPHTCGSTYGTYTCMEQGAGSYEVTLKHREQSFKQALHVEADSCHVIGPASLDFTLPAAEGPECPDQLALVAEVDLSGISYERVEIASQQFTAPFQALDDKLQVYAAPGRVAAVEQTLQFVFDSQRQCASVEFVPRPNACGYDRVAIQMEGKDIALCGKAPPTE